MVTLYDFEWRGRYFAFLYQFGSLGANYITAVEVRHILCATKI